MGRIINVNLIALDIEKNIALSVDDSTRLSEIA